MDASELYLLEPRCFTALDLDYPWRPANSFEGGSVFVNGKRVHKLLLTYSGGLADLVGAFNGARLCCQEASLGPRAY